MPIVSAQVGLYPLRQQEISPMIDEVLGVLARYKTAIAAGQDEYPRDRRS